MGIPVFIIGHDANGKTVNLSCIADEYSLDDSDKYRLFDLRANCCNRDGFALRFCLEKLKKIVATDKLMFVISDGSPNSDHYGMEEGKADCQSAVHDALRQGIQTVTAGLGADAPFIRYVYQDGRAKNDRAEFLDVSDVQKLPKLFVKIIKDRILDQSA